MRQYGWCVAVTVCIGALLICLYRFPPETYSFYPQCLFHAATGLLCPGCGATRALAALLHGHLVQAIRFNALFVALLPPAIVYGGAVTRRAWRQDEVVWGKPGQTTLLLLGAVTGVFTVWRNLA